jgi:hypothetical protein
MFKGFPKEGLEFLSNIIINNSKEWLDEHSYLYLMGAIYAYTTYEPDVIFHSEAIIERHFKVYEDMLELQQWVYELTLYNKESV